MDNLIREKAKYHHKCNLKFCKDKLKEAEDNFRKRKSKQEVPENTDDIAEKAMRKSVSATETRDLICCFCVETDVRKFVCHWYIPSYHEKNEVSHVQNLTVEWKKITSTLKKLQTFVKPALFWGRCK